MKILIIGGTGFIGSHVVRHLNEDGHTVAVFHRGEKMIDRAEGIREILGDRDNFSFYRSHFSRFAPDVVIDIIPYTEQDAVSLVETFKNIAGRMVVLSSGDVYRNYELLRRLDDGPPHSSPLDEDAPLRVTRFPHRSKTSVPAEHAYNYEKILVERVVMGATELPGTVLRLPVVYGPGDRQRRLFLYLKRMTDGRNVVLLETGQEKWRWTRGYVENVAAAIALAARDDRAANRIYNTGEESALTEKEWIDRIANETGWDGRVLTVDAGLLPEKMRSGLNWEHHLATNTHRIRDQLDYKERVAFREGLAGTIAWELANPPENISPEQFDYAAEDEVLSNLEHQTDFSVLSSKDTGS